MDAEGGRLVRGHVPPQGHAVSGYVRDVTGWIAIGYDY